MDSCLDLSSAGGPPRVLVIEPNRNYLGVVARRLSEFGYRLATAESAQSGLSELYRIPADLVLCTAKMPGTSGIELVRMIREDALHREVPVLLVVERSDPASAIEAFRAGADSVIRKPCHFEVLGACIARHLARARCIKQLVQTNAALDARAMSRAIELREVRDELDAARTEQRRLAAIVEGKAA